MTFRGISSLIDKFEDFNFLDYTPSAGDQPFQKLEEYLDKQKDRNNHRGKSGAGARIIARKSIGSKADRLSFFFVSR